ncbi:hypothetical protein ACIGKM_07825 [Ectopseudomonas toyotomiensis]|uniref:hypothetical protein n=1 Tax=Ectopseudomonas toyotomiensis TaxID=554344 RepID=UPI0037C899FE
MSDLDSLAIDVADVRAVARVELQTIRTQLQAIGAACSDPALMQLIAAAQHQVAEANDVIAGQVAFLAQSLEQFAVTALSQKISVKEVRP